MNSKNNSSIDFSNIDKCIAGVKYHGPILTSDRMPWNITVNPRNGEREFLMDGRKYFIEIKGNRACVYDNGMNLLPYNRLPVEEEIQVSEREESDLM